MYHLNFLPLAEVKEYLKIEADQTNEDALLINQIAQACRYVERSTGVMLYARDLYFNVRGCTNVYQRPINTDVATLPNIEGTKKGLYTRFKSLDGSNQDFILNVGTDTEVGYEDLKSVCVEMVELLYTGTAESGVAEKGLSTLSLQILDENKGFV